MFKCPPPATDGARALSVRLGTTLTAGAILARRGWTDPEEAARFFDPKLAHLTPPVAMADRSEAARRIARAVRQNERICVFGDYDADGVTSTAILVEILRSLGGEVVPVLADRFAGGYGLSMPALERVLETGASLLVTCDCGSSDHERLEVARRKGLDVVVIDHHRVPGEPLPVVAFLNPHRPECGFPYKGLASCGLALSMGAALRTELGADLDVRNWLDLVALGTIADVAPLDGDNRALVRAGLTRFAARGRPGLRALAEVAGYDGTGPVTGEDIAFRFAPRINAPGRLESADLALRLLLAKDASEARMLAAEAHGLCEKRKALDRAMAAEAELLLQDPAFANLPVIVLGKEGWHPGVVGIVAGRLAEKYQKPTIIVGFEGGTGRGSVRGPAGVSLVDALARCSDVLLGFGGHHAAAGVHLEAHRLDALRERFAAALAEQGFTHASRRERMADALLEETDTPEQVLGDLERFEPCGQGNPLPLLALRDVPVRAAREVRGGHLQIEVALAGRTLRGFGFELGHRAKELGPSSRAHVFGRLRRDSYRGGRSAEVRVEEVVLAGA